MSEFSFYSLADEQRKSILEISLGNYGKVVSMSAGMCGEVYIFDQGEHVVPRYVCAKVPKKNNGVSEDETAKRFVKELKNS
jgi:hypothetical protein